MVQRYEATIRELHIEKLKNRELFELSGGQKQTIAFASVYALNPDIFVLDEPSSNLDPEAIEELRRLCLLIKEMGKTIIVSEHRLYFLMGFADKIVLMKHGMLERVWTAEEFKKIPKEEYQKLGLRSYFPTCLNLPEGNLVKNEIPVVSAKHLLVGYRKRGSGNAGNKLFCIPRRNYWNRREKWLWENNLSQNNLRIAEGNSRRNFV